MIFTQIGIFFLPRAHGESSPDDVIQEPGFFCLSPLLSYKGSWESWYFSFLEP